MSRRRAKHHAFEALRQPGRPRGFEVALRARALPHRPFVPVDAEPCRSAITPSLPPGTFRAGSVSSILRSSQSPNRRFATALSAFPTCSVPSGSARTGPVSCREPIVQSCSASSTVSSPQPGTSSSTRGHASSPVRARPRHRRLLRLGGPKRMVEGRPAPKDANPGDLALALAAVAAYYLVFILGWIRILAAWGIRIPYRVALQAEMVSMLAKYLPGGVWTPAARAVALRRVRGRHRHADGARLDLRRGRALGDLRRDRLRRQPRLGARRERAAAVADRCSRSSRRLLHPRIFRPLGRQVLRPFGPDAIEPLPFPVTIALLSSTAARG